MSKVIKVNNLTREYESTTGWIRKKKVKVNALNGVSFEVANGANQRSLLRS